MNKDVSPIALALIVVLSFAIALLVLGPLGVYLVLNPLGVEVGYWGMVSISAGLYILSITFVNKRNK